VYSYTPCLPSAPPILERPVAGVEALHRLEVFAVDVGLAQVQLIAGTQCRVDIRSVAALFSAARVMGNRLPWLPLRSRRAAPRSGHATCLGAGYGGRVSSRTLPSRSTWKRHPAS
jgi:hypothetical protein